MMFTKISHFCLLATFVSSVLLATSQEILQNDVEKLEVQVYYETLCYDSMTFIFRQLYPSWDNRKEYMDLKLIPYGKAIHNLNTTTGEWIIECQHGSAECKLNRVHACILDSLQFDLAFRLITCGMRSFRATLEECAPRMRVNLEQIYSECANVTKGTELLVNYGDQTKKISLSFVPSVGIDKIYDYDEQPDILQNFDLIFCQKYFVKFNKVLDGCSVTDAKSN
ncbi:GILT-like protein 2 [Bradysia coprophila]|uniref:GILT-like protein 2 n=1 Tax=Bradysia coprophila TaxID=38358 RepID=UPI00187DCBF2|nr:GILT-like protein 2 [Bradysia coprophila]